MIRVRRAWWLLALALWPWPAAGLQSGPSAFRIEDRKRGNLWIGDTAAEIEAGEVYGTVVLLWGNLQVRGQVEEVIVVAGKATFHPGSRLTKSLVVMGGEYESLPGAEVNVGDVVWRSPGPLWKLAQSAALLWQEHISGVLRVLFHGGVVLGLWLVGYLLFRGFSGLAGATAGRLSREWAPNLVVGILGTILVPVLFVLLVVSILGIAALPFYFLMLGGAALVSYLATALWVGERLWPAKMGNVGGRGLPLGILALQVCWVLGIWWGVLLVLVLWTLGWGALLRGSRRLWR